MRNTIIIIIGFALLGCKTSYIQEKKIIMENNKKIDCSLIINQLDTDAYLKNKGSNARWSYFLENGTEIKMTDINYRESEGEKYRTFQMKTIPAKPCFYTLYQTFYYNGKIKERRYLLTGGLDIGIREFYDELGNKTEVNEDLKFLEFTYNDVLLFLHKKNLIDIYTGENREKITIAYYKEPYWYKKPKPIWVVNWIDDKEKFTRIIYHLDAKTGKIIAYGKGGSESNTIILK